MKDAFEFSLKNIRNDVDDEQIGFRLYGDKAKPAHFASGFFRRILGEHLSSDLLGRMSYVVNARGQIKRGCGIEEVASDLQENGILEPGVEKENLQALRSMMQSLLSADSAVFGDKGSDVSYSAAGRKFVTSKARYEEVGEIGAGIIQEACPALVDYIEILLKDQTDELSILFEPLPGDMVENEGTSDLPKWIKKPSAAWKAFIQSVGTSGEILLANIKRQPKLLAIRTVIHFSIFHLLRYLAKQESFHDRTKSKYVIPLLAVYASSKRSSLVATSRRAFQQIGQSMARFYASSYVKKFFDCGMDYDSLMSTTKAPLYDAEKKMTKADQKKSEQNNEVWRNAKVMASEEDDTDLGLLRLGEAVHNMVATASDVNPLKYIRGIARLSGIVYPNTPRVIPYFRFSQDITSMLVLSSVDGAEGIPGEEFLRRLRENFDVVTGADEGDFDFCTENLLGMMVDEDELVANGNAFVERICDMGYGKILADGIFMVSTGV